MAMLGMVRSKPIQARVAAIVARTENDAYRENKGALKELVESATQIAQAQGRANFGTAIHEFTELLDAGTLDWSYVPEALKGPLDAYAERMQEFTTVDTEVFVTVDSTTDTGKPLRAAGSLDRLIQHPDLPGVCVADIKTGTDEPRYPLGVTTQVAIYSRGKRYRDLRFSGSPAFTDGESNPSGTAWRKELNENMNYETGILIHLPLEPSGTGHECTLYTLDLNRGWENLMLGSRVQEARRPPKLKRLG